jgi:GT2 family glycosyltransferase/glycosyltransferase involved in cell wall biosynthesis
MFDLNIFLSELQNIYNNSDRSKAIYFILSQIRDNSLNDEQINKLKYYLGREYFFQNEFDKAENIFKELLSLNNNEFGTKVYLSEIFFNKNKIIDSIYLLNEVYRSNPENKHLLEVISQRISVLNNFQNIKTSIPLTETSNQFPLISIIILCYNKSEMIKRCLKSLFENTTYPNYEVIILDNASVDDTPDFLLSYGNKIKFIRAEKNLGFVEGNNYAANFADGNFLVFLNNDTEPQKGWLNTLYSTFEYYKDAGAAGSKLIYPDGKLQEAGGVIFNDATGWNYGRGDDPNDSKYSYCKEVDYCSGAALMIRKSLFEEIGRFDNRFAPAYYEDTDLCFCVRKFGYKVYFNPFSKVIHHEGATAGTDLNSGFKKFQVINHPKFVEKWKAELDKQYPNNPKLRYKFSDRNKGKRILIIDDIPPLPDRAAGALRHYHTLNEMLNLGYKVTYVHLMGKQYLDESGVKYLTEFKMRGVEFIWFNYEYWYFFRETENAKSYIKTLINSLELKERDFDFVYIAFWHIAEYFIDLIKSIIPDVPILIDTMDIHYLREIRQAELSNDKSLMSKALENKKRELIVYSKADCITTVTEADRIELKKHLNNKPIFILTDVHNVRNNTPSFNERKDIMFVGNFNHSPNEDAVLYFVKEIFPLIKKQLPEIKFYIVGNNPSEKIKALSKNDIIVTGWVFDVKDYIDKCRIEVVPLRFGAGNKGKVGEALSSGLPIVTTSIGAEGMGIENEVHAFVTDEPVQFANYVIKLYNSEDLWNKFSELGKKLVAQQYSSTLMRKRLEFIFNHTKRNLLNHLTLKFSTPPKISIIIILHNNLEYTTKCLKSIKDFIKINYEIIVIDNSSTDKTYDYFKNEINYVKYFYNEKNIGFPAAVNQGINKALGDYILILNNDTILTENLVERLIEVAESEPKIGIVGPISNEVSGLQKDKNAKYNSIEEMHKYAAEIQQKNKGEILHFPRVAFLCTLIKREVIDKIGGLDERFSPGNYEDDDFCLRAQLAGYKTVIAKDVFIHHYGSKSFKANGEKAYAERLMKNQKIFVEKWGATPDEIWLQNKKIKPHQIYYPINKDLFKQYFDRARVHLLDKELDLAKENIILSIENYNSSSGTIISYLDLLNMAGNISLAANDLDNARKFFEMELNHNNNSAQACFGLGKIFYIINNLEAAKTMFEWALKNDPNLSQAKEALEDVNITLGYNKDHNSLVEYNSV